MRLIKVLPLLLLCTTACLPAETPAKKSATLPVGVESQDTGGKIWGPETGGSQVSLSSPKQSYHFDEPIHLNILCRNLDPEPLILVRSSLISDIRLDVRLPDGSPAPFTLRGKEELVEGLPSTEIQIINLAQGEEHLWHFHSPNSLFDMTLAGDYRVTIHRTVSRKRADAATKRKAAERFHVPSNTITVEVHEHGDRAN